MKVLLIMIRQKEKYRYVPNWSLMLLIAYRLMCLLKYIDRSLSTTPLTYGSSNQIPHLKFCYSADIAGVINFYLISCYVIWGARASRALGVST